MKQFLHTDPFPGTKEKHKMLRSAVSFEFGFFFTRCFMTR